MNTIKHVEKTHGEKHATTMFNLVAQNIKLDYFIDELKASYGDVKLECIGTSNDIIYNQSTVYMNEIFVYDFPNYTMEIKTKTDNIAEYKHYVEYVILFSKIGNDKYKSVVDIINDIFIDSKNEKK